MAASLFRPPQVGCNVFAIPIHRGEGPNVKVVRVRAVVLKPLRTEQTYG